MTFKFKVQEYYEGWITIHFCRTKEEANRMLAENQTEYPNVKFRIVQG
jgi:hypothetical protein